MLLVAELLADSLAAVSPIHLLLSDPNFLKKGALCQSKGSRSSSGGGCSPHLVASLRWVRSQLLHGWSEPPGWAGPRPGEDPWPVSYSERPQHRAGIRESGCSDSGRH